MLFVPLNRFDSAILFHVHKNAISTDFCCSQADCLLHTHSVVTTSIPLQYVSYLNCIKWNSSDRSELLLLTYLSANFSHERFRKNSALNSILCFYSADGSVS